MKNNNEIQIENPLSPEVRCKVSKLQLDSIWLVLIISAAGPHPSLDSLLYIHCELSFWTRGFSTLKVFQHIILHHIDSIYQEVPVLCQMETPHLTPKGRTAPTEQWQLSTSWKWDEPQTSELINGLKGADADSESSLQSRRVLFLNNGTKMYLIPSLVLQNNTISFLYLLVRIQQLSTRLSRLVTHSWLVIRPQGSC